MTVNGTTTSSATNVTVNGLAALWYADNTFARTNVSLANGSNTFIAIAQDALGRKDTNSVTCYLPATNLFSYDGNGNLLSDGNRNFAYDDENQLTSVWVTNGWRSDFVYDGKMRRRIRREYTWFSGHWLQTNEVHYLYDGNLVIQERDANNVPTLSYTRGRDLSGRLHGAGGAGGLLAMSQGSGASLQHSFYHTDGNGNITALLNSNQAIVARYLYDPFGNILGKGGPLADANLYRFSSKELHPTSGMLYYGYRFYDPGLLRWSNRDPIGERGGLNLYGYVDNNPMNLIDPIGLTDYPEGFIGPLLPRDTRGGDTQFGVGIGGLIGGNPLFVVPSPFVGGAVNVGVTSSGKAFIQFQGTGMAGLGLFGGVDVHGIIKHTRCPTPVSISTEDTFHGEANAGWEAAAGAGAEFSEDAAGVDFSIPKLDAGAGYGVMVGAGVMTTTTIASPQIFGGGTEEERSQTFQRNYHSLPGKYQ